MTRQEFIKKSLAGFFAIKISNLNQFYLMASTSEKTPKMPALFLAHGNPMNAISDNPFTQNIKTLGTKLPKPKAILAVSAHWETNKSYVSTSALPETIYDFSGFPPELYAIKYPAPGSPETAHSLCKLAPEAIFPFPNMGLDHGTWSVLIHLFPNADIPVFQLSLNRNLSPEQHFSLAKQLYKLRENGIMLIGSGNIIHNLRRLDWTNPNASPNDWAVEFDMKVKYALDERNFNALIQYNDFGPLASLAIPTNEHYLPLLYLLGFVDDNDSISYPWEKFEYGSLSMRCVFADS
jgi:4,5-DOPA dioxygenase extradiol